MKKNYIVKVTGLLIVFILSVFVVTAQQTGRIAGKVTDKKSGEALIGLTVKVEGTSKGVSTDIEGRYNVGSIASGRYSVIFSYVGYQTKRVSDIVVKNGSVATVDVVMEESAGTELQQVVITATARQESISGLYAKQKTNISISDGISAEQIRRSPDRNTSDVLKRVSGTSIQDNKFVVIRGLSDRYNTTLLNNAVLPSTETDKKAFSFDIIPSNMIDNIIINKTASPEYPGDFAGGIVQVITKDIPDENFLSVNIGLGYNSQSTFDPINLGARGKYEFLGFSESSRNIPAGIPSSRVFMQEYTSPEQKVAAGKLFSNSYKIDKYAHALPVQSLQANLGLTKRFQNTARLGAVVAVTYRSSESVYDAVRIDYEGTRQYKFDDTNNKFSTSLGGLANFAYIKGDTKIALKNVYNRSLDNSYLSRSGIMDINRDSVIGYSQDLVTKSLFNSQLEGEHKTNWKDIKINWNLNYSYSGRNQPDLKSLTYNNDFDNGDPEKRIYLAQIPTTVSRTDASRFFSSMDEDTYGGGLNFTLPFNLFKEKNNVKAGIFKQYKSRDFEARKFGYIQDAYGDFDQSLKKLPIDAIFNSANIRRNGFLLDEGTEFPDTYTAISDINAGFLQVENKFNSKMRAVWGIRAEDSYQFVDTYDLSGSVTKIKHTYLDILPSLNITYSINDQTNLRLSASKTVTRPELRELANFGFFDYVSKRILQGNPDLKRSQNTNVDLKYEFYPGSGQVFSLSGFYKYFKNPIEQTVSSAATRNITFQNANSATSYGMEVEFRKRLNFFGSTSFLNNVTAYANSSIIFSTVNLNSLVSEVTSRALQGQSPYIINAGLQYSSSDNNLSFNLLYNRIGNRISEVGYEGYPDIYEQGRNVIDFQISKKIYRKAEVRLNLSDMLNEKTVFYQNQDSDKLYDPAKDNLMNSLRMGYNVSLSFIYNFSLEK
ncbi:TonB-dependent receptor [Arcticibacter tournemirensis]|uniref:TonB-dependent receptor n=1 Tax=Arcticibacter tournemirensis TaxID=699437 RepID=A0A4Q0M3K4_9SPHI|nr:TonB-dependent receptor [Arcticibacter tournemirensis]RXF67259.1 TonB-dependent receptor [Arcticibacter tournemirensis]